MTTNSFCVYDTAHNIYAFIPLPYGSDGSTLTDKFWSLRFPYTDEIHDSVLKRVNYVKALLGINGPNVKLITTNGLIDSYEDGEIIVPTMGPLPYSISQKLETAPITKFQYGSDTPLAGFYSYTFNMTGYTMGNDLSKSSSYISPYKIVYDRQREVYTGQYNPRGSSYTGGTFYDFAGAGNNRDIVLKTGNNYDITTDRNSIITELNLKFHIYYSQLNSLLRHTDHPIQIAHYTANSSDIYYLCCIDPTANANGYPLGTSTWRNNQVGYKLTPIYYTSPQGFYFVGDGALYKDFSPTSGMTLDEYWDAIAKGGPRTYFFGNNFARIYTQVQVEESPNLITGNTYVKRYIDNVFNGELPTYSQALQDEIDEAIAILDNPGESIYTPGGDTADPHNPYPEGDSPATVDPLDSGEETDSPETEGEWELPFDEVPDEPSDVHSVALGLYNAYALSAMQVEELANYLFSGITEVGENLVKLIWGSKRDVIISLIEFPIMVTTQGTEEIRFIFDTALAGMFHGKQLTTEYLPIDFGTIEVPRYSGTFYDFEPYTTLTLYIPYIGYIDLKPTEVVGSTLSISGYIHLTTGEIAINVKSSRTGRLGTYSGTIGRMLPIADADATEIYSAIIKTAASLGAVAVAGVGAASASSAAAGISAPSKHAVEIAQQDYQNAIMDWGTATKGIRGKQAEMMNKGVSYESAVSSYNEQSAKYNQVNKAASNSREDFHDAISEAGSNSIGAVTTGFNVSRGTIMTSSNGRLSPQRCFLRIEVPHQNVSRNQKILGYPANSADSLNSDRLHGYTELRSIELTIPRATLTELQELEDILRGGFYLP